MYSILSRALISLCCFTVAVPVLLGAPAEYSIIDLGTLGGVSSNANAINQSGHVVGSSQLANGNSHAFFYDGTMHDLGTVGGPLSFGYGINDNDKVVGDSAAVNSAQRGFVTNGPILQPLGVLGGGSFATSHAYGINDFGFVTGTSATGGPGEHAFLYDGSSMHDLGTLGGVHSYGMAISNSGQVTGYAHVSLATTISHAFLYNGMTMQDIGTLGGDNSFGFAINSNGHVTGKSDNVSGSGTSHAFLFDGSSMVDLGALGPFSEGRGINSFDHVVGSTVLPNFTVRAFIYDSSNGMRDLNDLISPNTGWVLKNANGINDSGWITGTGTINGLEHAFLLTPIPEPTTTVLLLVLSSFSLLRRWHRAHR